MQTNAIVNRYIDKDGAEVVCLAPHVFGALRVERRGRCALILRRLQSPKRRYDGRAAGFELEYRWLLADDDNELATVRGCEHSYWRSHEFEPKAPLFEQFAVL